MRGRMWMRKRNDRTLVVDKNIVRGQLLTTLISLFQSISALPPPKKKLAITYILEWDVLAGQFMEPS